MIALASWLAFCPWWGGGWGEMGVMRPWAGEQNRFQNLYHMQHVSPTSFPTLFLVHPRAPGESFNLGNTSRGNVWKRVETRLLQCTGKFTRCKNSYGQNAPQPQLRTRCITCNERCGGACTLTVGEGGFSFIWVPCRPKTCLSRVDRQRTSQILPKS